MNQSAHRKAKAKMYSHCIRCGEPKEIPKHVAAKRPPTPGRGITTPSKSYVDPEVYAQDEFCSRTCCEADYAERTEDGEDVRMRLRPTGSDR